MLTYLEINKSAIAHNLRQIKQLVGPDVAVMAVIKSNAYGHGMVEVAKIAAKAGANWLGVISDSEALALRQAKIKAPIFILSFWDQAELKNKIKKIYNCDFPVYSIEQAKFLSQLGQKIRKTINIHIKIDTGASRVGIRVDEAVAFIKKIKNLPRLNLCGIFTHYAASEDSDQTFTNQQTDKFARVIDTLEKQGVDIVWRHAACSAATMVNRQTLTERIGINLYPGQSSRRPWFVLSHNNIAKLINTMITSNINRPVRANGRRAQVAIAHKIMYSNATRVKNR